MSPEDLKRFALFAEFAEEDRELLVELLEERSLAHGRSVFREGVESDGLVLLSEGRLKLESGRSADALGELEAPAHLGATGLFSLGKREVSAFAEGPATVQILPRAALARLVEDAPRAAFRLAEAVLTEFGGWVREELDGLAEHDLADAP